jgi:hypothetical protein
MSKDEFPWVIDNGEYATVFSHGVQPKLELPTGFGFVLNVASLVPGKHSTQLILGEGVQLRRATDTEIVAIKEVLKTYLGRDSWDAWQGGPMVGTGKRGYIASHFAQGGMAVFCYWIQRVE